MEAITNNYKYSRKLDPFNLNKRDNEIDYKPKLNTTYEFTLSYGRSIARTKPATNTQYFQGSSILRKKKPKPEPEKVQKKKETASKCNDESKSYQMGDKILGIKKVRSKQQLEGKTMSRRTKTKIKEKIFAIYESSKNDFFFLTLTFIEQVPDTKAVKILNNFLTATKKRYGNFNYIWVAERQKTGNIHFHIILDKRFDVLQTNALWVMQQINAGLYHKNIIKLMRVNKSGINKIYKSGAIGYKAIQKYFNPLDVIQVKTIDGLSMYLTNYITKNDTKMTCSVWHCNRNVSRLFTKQIISKKVFYETSDKRKNYIVSKKGKRYENTTFVHQYGMINTIVNKSYFKRYLKELKLINSWILNDKKCKIKWGHLMYLNDYLQFINNDKPSRSELINNLKNGFVNYIYKKV